MRIEVVTGAVARAGDVVRTAATRLDAIEVPPAGCDCGDIAADDAVRALLDVVRGSVVALARDLRTTAVMLDVAVADYCRAEVRLAGSSESAG